MSENNNIFMRICLKTRDLAVEPPRTNLDTAIGQRAEMVYRTTRIVHLAFFSIIPIIILAIFIILLLQGNRPSISTDLNSLIIVLYIGSICILITGALIPTIFFWPRYQPDSFEAINRIFKYHVCQLVDFVIPALFGGYFWYSGAKWFLVLPYFALSTIALILTFPTRKNWERWRFG
jgi:hypothetical protein